MTNSPASPTAAKARRQFLCSPARAAGTKKAVLLLLLNLSCIPPGFLCYTDEQEGEKMIVYRKEVPFETSGHEPGMPADSACSRKLIPENSVFLDIETIGLSAKYHFVYCIGLAYYTENGAVILQYFAESRADEPELLESMLEFLGARKPVLITFNGVRFDLPFLEARCRLHCLPFDNNRLQQIDLLREIRPLKNLFGLSHLRQKDIERFLGIERDDQYDGGKLIEVYLQYEQTGEKDLRRLLLLHNFDDMKGMLSILPILSYRKLADGNFTIQNISFESGSAEREEISIEKMKNRSAGQDKFPPQGLSSNAPEAASKNPLCPGTQQAESENGRSENGNRNPQADSGDFMLCFTISYEFSLPRPLSRKNDAAEISLERNRGIIKMPVFSGTLKYFFPDYKNYYYLPGEDMAVHRSVGQFTDSAFREPAKKETCYIKKEGLFLPIGKSALGNTADSSGKNTAKNTKNTKKNCRPEKFYGLPVFYPSYRERQPFLEVTELNHRAETGALGELTWQEHLAFREILKEILIR